MPGFVSSINVPTRLQPNDLSSCKLQRRLHHRSTVRPARRPCITHVKSCEQPSEATNPPPPPPKQREYTPEVKELRSVLKKCSVYLIGPMGSGKTAVGKFLAYEIGFRFLDLDELIELTAKKSISQIFEDDGEKKFRNLESAVLTQVSPFIACCVSTGGGVVLRKENWGALQTGIVIYLESTVDMLAERLQGEKENRPLLKDAVSMRDRMIAIMNERKHLYEQADVVVRCGEMPVDEVVKEVIRSLTNFIKANPPKLATLYPGDLGKKDR